MPTRPTKILPLLLDKKAKGEKMFAVLIDPDKADEKHLAEVVALSKQHSVDFFFVGGSHITTQHLARVVSYCKANSSIPVVLFPGNSSGIDEGADALLYLSLLSGRNPEYLIGKHVASASMLKNSLLEIISTSYLLIDGGRQTTASYISGTIPIPSDKPEIAASTAFAGQLMGHHIVFLDCGSGAEKTISTEMVEKVKNWIDLPLLCGGGIDTADKAAQMWQAGADLVVVGNAIEQHPALIKDIAHRKAS